MTTKRVAAVDMGSNTTRLIVADVTQHADGRVTHETIERRSTITRLAEGVDKRGILLPEPITRVRNALIDYRQAAREHGAVFVLATATSAVRDADNGEAFLGEVEHGFAFRATLLTGLQEAETTLEGITSDPATAAQMRECTSWCIDIGGGSTEIMIAENGALTDRHSFQLGSVRLTERFLSDAGDPPSKTAIDAAKAAALSEIRERFPTPQTPALALGVAGTVTTIAAIMLDRETYDPDLVHGFKLTTHDVKAVIDRLAALPLKERERVRGLEPKRAPVIIGGFVVLLAALEHFGIEEITVSERDILDGIVRMAGVIAINEGIDEMPQAFGRTCC